jgi:hypothetical protein
MCPLCLATAALITGKVTSASGLAAIVIRRFGTNNAVANNPRPTSSKPFENERSTRDRSELESKERSRCQRA